MYKIEKMYEGFLFILYLIGKSHQYQPIIKNNDVPICKNCIYFENCKSTKNYDLGKCTKFGKINIISGNIEYDYAFAMRNSEDHCGKKGLYFEEKKYLEIINNIIQINNNEKKI